MAARFSFRRKPRKCPACGSQQVASILYGMPAFGEQLQRDLEAGKIILGGCCVSDHDPQWQCVGCGVQVYRTEEDPRDPG